MSDESRLEPEVAEFSADQDHTVVPPLMRGRSLRNAANMSGSGAASTRRARRVSVPKTGRCPCRGARSLSASIDRNRQWGRCRSSFIYHGGWWVFGGLDSHDLPAARLAVITGAAIVSVDYRLAPEHQHPAARDDAWDSLHWAIYAAAQLGFDPQRIAVAGDSAGGALAAGVALRARDRGCG